MKRSPDFFLTGVGESGQGVDIARVRACWTGARLASWFRDDYMLITVDPPIPGQEFGEGVSDVAELLIATRLQGDTLYPVSRWPLPVALLRILDTAIIESLKITQPGQVQYFFWAEIYRTREEAEAEIERHPIRYP